MMFQVRMYILGDDNQVRTPHLHSTDQRAQEFFLVSEHADHVFPA
jgi:hypothetical protein